MEFKSLKNITDTVKGLKIFVGIAIGAAVVISCWSMWQALSFAESQRQKIYVLDEGKSLMVALSQDLNQNRPVEAKEHLRRFHQLFFACSPDKSAIEDNINRALIMADQSAMNYYKLLLEKGFYNRIIAENVNQLVAVDSISLNLEHYPYTATTYARQKILRQSTVTERNLITTCKLINTLRSDNNPQGFMIENLLIIDNKDIATYDR
ncbi:MAG: conjugative transposon protein TraK [Alistipes sp.]|nr:conjugative transposon protein TraK [Alistipes sp.]